MKFLDVLNNIELEEECNKSRYLIIGTTIVVPKDYVDWLKEKILIYYKLMIKYGFINNEQVALEFAVKDNLDYFDIKLNNSNNWYNLMNYI